MSKIVFSRGHATLHPAVSVGPSVGRSIRHISKLRAVFALLLLPNLPRLDCRVSGLVLATWVIFGAARGLYRPLLQLLIPALAPLSLSCKEMAGNSVLDPFLGDYSIRN